MKRRRILIGLIALLIVIGCSPFAVKWLIYRSCLGRVEKLQAGIAELGPLSDELAVAKESLQAQIQFQEHVLPRYYASWYAWFFRGFRRLLTDTEGDLSRLRAGGEPFADKRGTFLLAYRSRLDDGLEPYFLDIPYSYDSSRAWPLVVQLHGLVGIGEPHQQAIPAHREDCLTLAPHGKGSIDYKWVAEQEVLRAIEEVSEAYAIDPERVYLQGHSMGATGAWGLAGHFPDRFAAISVSAGNTDHTVWEELWELPEAPEGSSLLPLRKFLEDADSPISYAENVANVPAYCVHGEKDDIVPVQHSRNMVEKLRSLGADVEYREVSMAPHSSRFLTPRSTQFDWLMARGPREAAPARVRVRASRLRYGGSHWIEIRRLGRLLELGQIEAEIGEQNSIMVTTRNIAELALTPPQDAVSGGGLVLNVDGQELRVRTDSGGPATVVLAKGEEGWAIADKTRGLGKRAGLEGPIEDAMMDRFIVVYGTQGADELATVILQREAEALREQWRMRFGYPCLLRPDTEISEEDIADCNLICYGRPDQNAIVKRAAEGLPVRFGEGAIGLGEEEFTGPGVGVKFCYPNPLQPDRYLVVFAANSWQAMFQSNNRFGNWFDWSAYENRHYYDYAVYDERTSSPETFLTLGYFDQYWKLSPDYRFDGSDDLRRQARPWRSPEHVQESEGVPELSLSDLLPAKVSQLLGAARHDASYEGKELAIGGRKYAKGFGVKAPSTLEFELGGRFSTFSAEVGVDLEEKPATENHLRNNNLVFEVVGDGKLLASSGILSPSSKPHLLECSIVGVRELALRVRQAKGRRWFLLSAAWAEPKVAR